MTIYDNKKVLDEAIIDTLYSEKQYRYRALKRRIEQCMPSIKSEISFDTYDRHIDRLVEQKILQRKEMKRAFIVYSLTKECRNKLDKATKEGKYSTVLPSLCEY